ncbi:hypothetical protein [Inconstantimicrobium mannanitabidum]|uniref:Uncharacterized protein n=1 Tax=Inconstantimicrobium mannanitabidum TaxID=1604901 RepID=A0ACB5RA40_9CLOT|nr:hypothetical protein [Clostridium sp. TW13]GKX65836.1 hypothetical protein rsdtw13_10940 [Clostridium sp. TW13]
MSNAINMIVENGVFYYGTFDTSNIDTFLAGLTDTQKLGLGKDSIKFNASPKLHDYDFAGKGDRKVKGMEGLAWEIKASGTCIDFNDKVLGASLLEKDSSNASTKFDVFKPLSDIKTELYKDLLIVGKEKGKTDPVAILIKNTYNNNGVSLEMKDKENAGVSLEFEGHYDMTDLDDAPFRIFKPKDLA